MSIREWLLRLVFVTSPPMLKPMTICRLRFCERVLGPVHVVLDLALKRMRAGRFVVENGVDADVGADSSGRATFIVRTLC